MTCTVSLIPGSPAAIPPSSPSPPTAARPIRSAVPAADRPVVVGRRAGRLADRRPARAAAVRGRARSVPRAPARTRHHAGEGRGRSLRCFDLEGFPVASRRDTIKHLGVDEGQMKEMGVDVGRMGFTIGLDANRKDDNGLPARKVGGLDIGLISNEDNDHGPATPTTTPNPTPPTTGTGVTTPPTTTASDGGTDAGAAAWRRALGARVRGGVDP